MSTFVYVTLLLFFTACLFNGLTFADSIKGFETSPKLQSTVSKINILFVSVSNDMPRGSPPVSYIYGDEPARVNLQPGSYFTKIGNFDAKFIQMYWKDFCIAFYIYHPSQEGNHQKIYWSLRTDGVYHSWDNRSWAKKIDWTHACN